MPPPEQQVRGRSKVAGIAIGTDDIFDAPLRRPLVAGSTRSSEACRSIDLTTKACHGGSVSSRSGSLLGPSLRQRSLSPRVRGRSLVVVRVNPKRAASSARRDTVDPSYINPRAFDTQVHVRYTPRLGYDPSKTLPHLARDMGLDVLNDYLIKPRISAKPQSAKKDLDLKKPPRLHTEPTVADRASLRLYEDAIRHKEYRRKLQERTGADAKAHQQAWSGFT